MSPSSRRASGSRYATIAITYYREPLSTRFAELDDPDEYFQELGEQIQDQFADLMSQLAGPDQAGEGYLAKTGRLNAARNQAEALVLHELLHSQKPENEPQDLDEETAEYCGDANQTIQDLHDLTRHAWTSRTRPAAEVLGLALISPRAAKRSSSAGWTGCEDVVMANRPYIILSVAASIDGYIDDNNPERLYLSNEADFDRVDEVRTGVDAVLIGANTVRRDNPKLRIRSQERRERRLAAGLPELPLKVTISSKGDLDPQSKFFATEDVEKLVYVPTPAKATAIERLGEVATVVGGGDPLDLHAVLADLSNRRVGRLMVEGGGHIHTQFLTAELVDEIHLAVAPFFVGDSTAPRLVVDGNFPQDFRNRMNLTEVRQIGDIALLRYQLNELIDA